VSRRTTDRIPRESSSNAHSPKDGPPHVPYHRIQQRRDRPLVARTGPHSSGAAVADRGPALQHDSQRDRPRLRPKTDHPPRRAPPTRPIRADPAPAPRPRSPQWSTQHGEHPEEEAMPTWHRYTRIRNSARPRQPRNQYRVLRIGLVSATRLGRTPSDQAARGMRIATLPQRQEKGLAHRRNMNARVRDPGVHGWS
jgi:hypothetical protein